MEAFNLLVGLFLLFCFVCSIYDIVVYKEKVLGWSIALGILALINIGIALYALL